MKINNLFTLFLLNLTIIVQGQNQFKATIIDSLTNEPLMGATVVLQHTTNGARTDLKGNATLSNIPNGKQTIVTSFIGYKSIETTFLFPIDQVEPKKIFLTPSNTILEGIVVEATRANKSIANLPTRTEVLTEEIDEAASMEPSKITHLITHSTGIQVQTTSATSNGAVVRIQGLNGRYTQMLKDGFPLFGGFSGSLDILQIPPLDLRQVEYIKGSASTLYGGGAIGGLINLLSKKAKQDETLLHINFSTIGAKDFNAFVSKRFGKFGYTNLASLHLHSFYEADKDVFSDIPEVSKFNFNPKLFYNPDSKTEFWLGANISKETRFGGNIYLIDDIMADSSNHFYFDKQKSSRYTTQFFAQRSLSNFSILTLKNSLSVFDRYIHIRENAFGESTFFGGQQFNSFTELNFNLNNSIHNLNMGLNIYTDNFTEKLTYSFDYRDQNYLTYGIYFNHLWDLNKKLALESGLRADFVQAKSLINDNNGELFVLPKLSALYKLNSNFSLRLGGGMGYRMPTIFNEEAEPYGYKHIQAIDFNKLKAERSYGGNFDFKYQSSFGTENVLFTFNQMFFYNQINKPIVLNTDKPGNLFFDNYIDYLKSRGFESQIKLTVGKFTWFFGYTYTDAFFQNNNSKTSMSLTPQHSIKGDLLFVEENKWRIGWDYEFKSEQNLSSGLKTRSLFTTGIIVERTFDNFVIFLNAENITDTRQTKYQDLSSKPYNTPQFTEIWAPLDGSFFNIGFKLKL